jgi:predicted enzyme related to lactoylglutathione lyase
LDQDLEVSPSGIGFSVTVADISRTLSNLVAHGGRVLREPYSLGPDAGFCARFADPNGNVLELYCQTAPAGGSQA